MLNSIFSSIMTSGITPESFAICTAVSLLCGLILSLANIIYTLSGFGEDADNERELRVTVPEDLNYTNMFEDLFKEYTSYHRLKSVKTTNMGSLYRLTYNLRLKDPESEKALIDGMRCRNGNLEIVCSCRTSASEEL